MISCINQFSKNGQVIYLLRMLKANRELEGSRLSKSFSMDVIKYCIKNKYVYYNKFKNKYKLTTKGEKQVIDFNRH